MDASYASGIKDEGTYNGWTNRATWNLALWAGNDEVDYRYIQARRPDEGFDEQDAETVARRVYGDETPDRDRLDDVNWAEIAEAWNEE